MTCKSHTWSQNVTPYQTSVPWITRSTHVWLQCHSSLHFTLAMSLCLCDTEPGGPHSLTQHLVRPYSASKSLHHTFPQCINLAVRCWMGVTVCVWGTESEVLHSVTRCLEVPHRMTVYLGSHTGPWFRSLTVRHRVWGPGRVTMNLRVTPPPPPPPPPPWHSVLASSSDYVSPTQTPPSCPHLVRSRSRASSPRR